MPTRLERARARREAERLFRRLRDPKLPREDELIRVIYPERFGRGKGFIAVTIPAVKITMGTGYGKLMAHKEHLALMATGPTIVICIPYPQMHDAKSLLAEARRLAREVQAQWGVRAVIFPGGPRIRLLVALEELTLART